MSARVHRSYSHRASSNKPCLHHSHSCGVLETASESKFRRRSAPPDGDASSREAYRREWVTKNVTKWRTCPSAMSLKIGELPQGLIVVEARTGACDVVDGWVAIEPRGYVRVENLAPASSLVQSFLQPPPGVVDAGLLALRDETVRAREANLTLREQEMTIRQELLALQQERATLRMERDGLRAEVLQLQGLREEMHREVQELEGCRRQRSPMRHKLVHCRNAIAHAVASVDALYSKADAEKSQALSAHDVVTELIKSLDAEESSDVPVAVWVDGQENRILEEPVVKKMGLEKGRVLDTRVPLGEVNSS